MLTGFVAAEAGISVSIMSDGEEPSMSELPHAICHHPQSYSQSPCSY